MAKFRKKPVVVEAVQYRAGIEDGWAHLWDDGVVAGFWATKTEADAHPPRVDGRIAGRTVPVIRTLEGLHAISAGDWIITGVKGERYPCKPGIFAATYEPVHPATPSTDDGGEHG